MKISDGSHVLGELTRRLRHEGVALSCGRAQVGGLIADYQSDFSQQLQPELLWQLWAQPDIYRQPSWATSTTCDYLLGYHL